MACVAEVVSDKRHVVLKCDVEGAEYGIFKDADAKILAEVYRVQIEFHNYPQDLSSMLNAAGFDMKVELKNQKELG